jgi:hypothetical protein
VSATVTSTTAITEPSRSTPVYGEFDVVVVGDPLTPGTARLTRAPLGNT